MKSILYLGLEVPDELKHEPVIHFPVIRIVPRARENQEIQNAFADFEKFTHLIFTSKSAVDIFFDYAGSYSKRAEISKKHIIAVGSSTAHRITIYGAAASHVATIQTAEGVTEILQKAETSTHALWPRSALARPLLKGWMQERGMQCRDCIFYDTVFQVPGRLPVLEQCKEIIFTSPSTVDAFLSIFGTFPKHAILTCIGPITRRHLEFNTFKRVFTN